VATLLEEAHLDEGQQVRSRRLMGDPVARGVRLERVKRIWDP
jgi:hypothetical protein